ncbi:P-loop containing nucleoside triphosphate hydrolase protein [Rhizophagus clarus]|uniref:P-loop containing nucleoside triphosphate hydrolase protein n=1 Tax=Rhizophagus clarus TaxID=94130 RepID=A0A8H3LD33_9GLOM|nr:P-loop containing nucleoside triphosphate hydrolase protein [Rhizophagus clarus]
MSSLDKAVIVDNEKDSVILLQEHAESGVPKSLCSPSEQKIDISFSFTNSSPPLRISEVSILSIVLSSVMGLVVSILLFFVSGDVIYAFGRSKYNEYLLNKTVEEGTRPKIDISDDKLVSRPLVVERLKKILQPDRDQSYYYLICGEHGTGKTTLTRIASSEVGCGVIYVDIPANLNELGGAFGNAINFALEKVSVTGQWLRKIKSDDAPKFSEWEKALKALRHASEVYKAKHDKPMVIVYDNVSHLVHENQKILDILQDDAKHSADDRKYIAVFVCSEGSVPRRMESRSAWSRAKTPVMEIGDLSKEESMKYLIKKRDIKEVDANKLFDLVGGRIIELKTVADDFLAGIEFEIIKQQVLNKVEKKFNTAQLLRKQLYHEVGKKVIKDLLDSKELGFTTFMEFFDNYEEASKVLETNVFSYHPEKNTVSFQSQSIEFYIRENAKIFNIFPSCFKIIEVD